MITAKGRRAMAAEAHRMFMASGRPVVVELTSVPACCKCGRVPLRGYHRMDGGQVQCLSPDSACMRLEDERNGGAA